MALGQFWPKRTTRKALHSRRGGEDARDERTGPRHERIESRWRISSRSRPSGSSRRVEPIGARPSVLQNGEEQPAGLYGRALGSRPLFFDVRNCLPIGHWQSRDDPSVISITNRSLRAKTKATLSPKASTNLNA
jgi:hypothetical protein